MSKRLVMGIVLLAGLGGGYGAGYLMLQPKLDASQAVVDNLTATVEEAELQSGETLKKAGEQIAKAKADSERSRTNAIRVNTELRKVKLDNQRLKAILAQAMEKKKEPVSATPEPTIQRTGAKPATIAAANSKPAKATDIATKEYTVRNGDSLWKIAANELGNGIRFEEILELNPPMTKDSKLNIGTKLKLPAK